MSFGLLMTSNMSVDAIPTQLDWMNEKDEQHIRITSVVGVSVEFLDVHVENSNGALMRSVFHKPAAELYVLPYSDRITYVIYISIFHMKHYSVLLDYVRIFMYLTGED